MFEKLGGLLRQNAFVRKLSTVTYSRLAECVCVCLRACVCRDKSGSSGKINI